MIKRRYWHGLKPWKRLAALLLSLLLLFPSASPALAAGGWSAMNSGTTDGFHGVWGSASNDVFAVGDDGTIVHYDGSSWSPMTSGTSSQLYAVWGSASNDVFSVGWTGTIVHYNGSSWSTMTSGTSGVLYDVWGSASNDVFATGRDGTILHYDGSGWSAMTSGTIYGLLGVWGSASNDVFAVGREGIIFHYDGSSWSAMTSNITSSFDSVWGSSATDVFAVGFGGAIFHYDGSSWSAMDSGISTSLIEVWGSSATDVFAVGISGYIRHYDGSSWSAMTSGTTSWLFDVWGSASDDVFAVGTSGAIIHYQVPDIVVSPTSIDLGSVLSGSSSSPQTITVSNGSDSTGNLIVGTITIGGADAAQFSIQSDNASGQTIAPGNSATLSVVFSPTSAGTKSATLSIPSNDSDNSPVNVSLSGTGTGPDIVVSPTSTDLGLVLQGSSSSPRTITVSNDGTGGNLIVGTITIGGTDAAQFSIQNDNASGQTIALGNSATLSVVFSPASDGTKSATLSIPSDDPDEATVNVSLSGTGVPVQPQRYYGGSGDGFTLLTSSGTYLDTVVVAAVTLYESDRTTLATSMNPQVEYAVKVTVAVANQLSDLSTVKVTLYYDADGTYSAGEVPGSGNTQTAAILTLTVGGTPVWTIDPSASTTWTIEGGSSTQPTLTNTSGDFWFHFKPGKVATETTASAKWQIHAVADDGTTTAAGYQDNRGMNWYGEVTVNTSTVTWTGVPPGADFGASTRQTGISVTYITNGNYTEKAAASSSWTGASNNATLNTAGTPGAGEFSIKVNDIDDLGTALPLQATPTYITIDNTGTQTGESGDAVATNTMWLKTGTPFPGDNYTGTVYHGISP